MTSEEIEDITRPRSKSNHDHHLNSNIALPKTNQVRPSERFGQSTLNIGNNLLLPELNTNIQARRQPTRSNIQKRGSSGIIRRQTVFDIPSFNKQLIRRCKQALRSNDIILVIIGITWTVLQIVDNYLFRENDYESTNQTLFLRVVILIFVLILSAWLWRRYEMKLSIQILKYQLSPFDTVFTTKLYRKMLLEILIWSIHCPPGLDSTFTPKILDFEIEFSYNDIFAVLGTLRFYLAIRIWTYFTRYTQEKAERICEINQFETNTGFAIKATLADSAYWAVTVIYAVFTWICAYALFVTERNDRYYYKDEITVESDIDNYWNSIWLTFITSSTIGYGDMYPQTHFGRLAASVFAILGNFFLGLIVVSLQSSLNYDTEEQLAFASFEKGERVNAYRDQARRCIRTFCTIVCLNRRSNGQYSRHGTVLTTLVNDTSSAITTKSRGSAIFQVEPTLERQEILHVNLWRKLSSEIRKFKQVRLRVQQELENDHDIIRRITDYESKRVTYITWKQNFIADAGVLLQASNLIMQESIIKSLAKELNKRSLLLVNQTRPFKTGTIQVGDDMIKGLIRTMSKEQKQDSPSSLSPQSSVSLQDSPFESFPDPIPEEEVKNPPSVHEIQIFEAPEQPKQEPNAPIPQPKAKVKLPIMPKSKPIPSAKETKKPPIGDSSLRRFMEARRVVPSTEKAPSNAKDSLKQNMEASGFISAGISKVKSHKPSDALNKIDTNKLLVLPDNRSSSRHPSKETAPDSNRQPHKFSQIAPTPTIPSNVKPVRDSIMQRYQQQRRHIPPPAPAEPKRTPVRKFDLQKDMGERKKLAEDSRTRRASYFGNLENLNAAIDADYNRYTQKSANIDYFANQIFKNR